MGVRSPRYTADMHDEHPIVSPQEWRRQREALLHEEKALTQQRDRLSERRRALPWVRVEPGYVFDTTSGPKDLAALFGPHDQLAVYHFMLAPDWEAGCKSCSFWADNFDGIATHLAHRDTALVAVSRAPIAKLQAYAARMGWSFEWVSSAGSTFNVDFGVSFTPEQLAAGEVDYNPPRRAGLPHVLGVWPRHRGGQRGVRVARSGAQGAGRGGRADGVAAPEGRV